MPHPPLLPPRPPHHQKRELPDGRGERESHEKMEFFFPPPFWKSRVSHAPFFLAIINLKCKQFPHLFSWGETKEFFLPPFPAIGYKSPHMAPLRCMEWKERVLGLLLSSLAIKVTRDLPQLKRETGRSASSCICGKFSSSSRLPRPPAYFLPSLAKGDIFGCEGQRIQRISTGSYVELNWEPRALIITY